MGLRIFVGSAPGREKWLARCLASLGRRPATVVEADGWELGKLRHVFENRSEPKFMFLQDSCEVVSEDFWSLVDGYEGSLGLLPDPAPFGCYMGVYERSVLERVEWPDVASKEESIRYEREWASKYAELAGGVPVLFPELTDADGSVVEFNGRTNLLLENAYFRKWKGTWR